MSKTLSNCYHINRDAAHTVHPLAGQGLNLGLSDVQTLSKVIENGLESGQDIGSVILLEDYAKRRYTQNVIMSTALHAIQRIFGTKSTTISLIRSLGLNAVNAIPIGKVKVLELKSNLAVNATIANINFI